MEDLAEGANNFGSRKVGLGAADPTAPKLAHIVCRLRVKVGGPCYERGAFFLSVVMLVVVTTLNPAESMRLDLRPHVLRYAQSRKSGFAGASYVTELEECVDHALIIRLRQ